MAVLPKISRLAAGVQRGVSLANNEILVNNIQIKGGSGSDTEYATFDGTALSDVRTITLPNTDVDLGDIADLVTLSGVAAGETDLGTFTGDTIPDDQTIKQALQALETAVEGAAGTTEFADDEFRIQDDGDATKQIAFQASGITTETTRTITMPDANVDLGDIADNSAAIADLQTLSGVAANAEDLGSFTGNIIPDESTIKAALQFLETEIESIPSPLFYAGTWNADTNSPDLDLEANRVQGALYRVTVAGTHDFDAFGGEITFDEGDKAVYNGSAWEKWDVQDNENTDMVTEGSTNLYFTDERAQDAVGSILTDSSTIDFTYDDAEDEITADVITQMSITSDESGVKLSGDAATPGNSKYYGTDGAGTKGFHDLPVIPDPESLVRIAALGEDIATSGVKALRWAKPANAETSGRFYLADHDAETEDNFHVVALYVAAGDEVTTDVVTATKMGKLTATGHGFTVGQPIFLGEDGALTSTAPSSDNLAVVKVGMAEDANTIDVNIQVMGVV